MFIVCFEIARAVSKSDGYLIMKKKKLKNLNKMCIALVYEMCTFALYGTFDVIVFFLKDYDRQNEKKKFLEII